MVQLSDPLSASAVVPTSAAPRYAKQLVAHLGRRANVQSEPEGERLLFDTGSCLLVRGTDALRLHATAETLEGLQRVENIVGGHLERFGQRDGLAVSWQDAS
jgi:hypothetical protein